MENYSMAGAPQRDNYIRVGDFITLKFLKHQCYLSAEGVLVEDVYVTTSMKFFEENLFQIYVQRQYSATNELEEFMNTVGPVPADQATKNHMEALIKGKENESALNKNLMKSKIGNVVSFGDTIQLLHVKSGKFITVLPTTSARDERENMKVTLSADGSVMSWLKIMPRYKINREGETFPNGTEVLMKISERATEYLHCAERPPPRGKLPEVNSSLESPTPWRINVFQRMSEVNDKSKLLAGQLVYIRDPESQCLLAALPRPANLDAILPHVITKVSAMSPNADQGVFPGSPMLGSRKMNMFSCDSGMLSESPMMSRRGLGADGGEASPAAQMSPAAVAAGRPAFFGRPADAGAMINPHAAAAGSGGGGGGAGADGGGADDASEASLSSVDEFLNEFGEVVLKPIEEMSLDTGAIWMMESKSVSRGGVVDFRTERVHFRHLNTGKYLAVQLRPTSGTSVEGTCVATLEKEPSEKGTLFAVNMLHSSETHLRNAQAVQLKHVYFDVSFERGKYNSSREVFTTELTRQKSKAVSLILSRYHEPSSVKSSSARLSRLVPSADETLDVYFGAAVMYHLMKFVRGTHIPHFSVAEATTIWPRIDPADRGLFTVLLTRMALFVRGYPTSLNVQEADNLAKFKPDKNIIVRRQNMAREQGLIQALLVLLKTLKPISDLLAQDSSGSSSSGSSARAIKSGFLEMGREVLAECLSLIYDLIKHNLTNQLYIADHLLVILAHVSTDKTAAKVAQELLSSNRELQETKIGKKEITVFAEKMREVPLNSMYLQLLQTCCSCLGTGLPRNQETVLSVVFQRYEDVLISTTQHVESIGFGNWGQGTAAYEMYVAPYLGKQCIRGEQLITDGLLTLTMSWSTRSARVSAEKLFGRAHVPIWDVYRQNFTSGSTRKPTSDSPILSAVQSSSMKRLSLDTQDPPPMFSRKDSAVIQSIEQKRAIAEFFISQLELAAEMCLGRNYQVINVMERRYSYEALVTMLVDSPHDSLKRSAAYLILTLYVDRDPQTQVQLPRLTRTLTDVSSKSCTNLVYVDGPAAHQFGLLQATIANHLRDITNGPFLSNTHQFMKLLQRLVEFHFYGRPDLMRDIIALLVGCLKRDDFDLNEDVDGGQFANSLMKLSTKMVQASNKRSGRRPSTAKSSDAGGKGGSFEHEDSISEGDMPTASELTAQARMDFNMGVLKFMEGCTMQLLIMGLAVLTGAFAIYQVIFDDESFIYIYAIDALVCAIFLLEMLLHGYLHYAVNGEIVDFLTDKHTALDALGIVLYVVVATISIRVSHFAKFFKLTRLYKWYESWLEEQQADEERRRAAKEAVVTWMEPDRYFKTSDKSINTMVKIVQILCALQRNIEDHNLSFLLRGYYEWSHDPNATPETVDKCFVDIAQHGKGSELTISSEECDDIYIDLLMYSHPDLVQTTLQLLMIHHSSRRILLENAGRLQLITTEVGEQQYDRMEKIVKILVRDADTHEIWGKLVSDNDRQTNETMKRYLRELTENCRKPREVLSFDESHEPVRSTQNILRNLGCFRLCMKIISLIESIDKDDPFSAVHANTRELARTCNRLLYWFVLDNPINQTMAYEELGYFIKTIDEKIDSHHVITAIFSNNITLMETVPKKYISKFVELICSQGRFPPYLSLMMSIIKVGEKNVIANQYEVIKLLSSPENQKRVVQFFTPVSHPEYAKKMRLMSPYLGHKDVSVEELPFDLAYHLELTKMLSSCTVGRSGMTTIEAKVQSMFFFVDIVEAMLDPNCLLLAKIRMGLHLYNAMLDVETLLPAVKDADCIWKLLLSTLDVLTFAKDDLRKIEKDGWEHPSSCRQRVEYMLVCAMIVKGYFEFYYDFTIFKPDIGQVAPGVERLTIKEAQANDIIKSLFMKISTVYEMLSPLLAAEHHELLFGALEALNKAAKEKIVLQVENIHESFLRAAEDYSQRSDRQNDRSFEEFVAHLTQHAAVTGLVEDQVQVFLGKIESLPWKTSAAASNVCFEPLIEKLVSHVRSTVQIATHGDESQKFVDAEATRTGVWLLRIFRAMIENRWGMSIYERDDDGGEEQDEAVVELMQVYNESGMAIMCLDLIARGIDISLQAEALKLLVGMLFREGGALDIQQAIYAHLNKPGSDMFFRTVRHMLHNLMSWHKWNGVVTLEEGQEADLPDEIILVRSLQLMCEGHFGPNQDIMREQPNNAVSINLLDDFVLYLQALDNIKCRTSTAAEMAVSALVLEVIQGPCEGNQDYFALSTELIETVNRKIRQHPVNDCDEGQEIELKKSYIDILQALLEGQARKTSVYERMLSVIHIDVIQVLCRGESKEAAAAVAAAGSGSGGAEDDATAATAAASEESEESVALRTESLVLMQMLTDFRPSLKKELGLDDDDDFSKMGGDSVACIEVVWRGELQRRFFHVPDICLQLAKITKDQFIANVKRASPEDKLYGLLEAAKEMYREILHQQMLTDMKLNTIFSRTTQDRASWASFVIVFTINLLFLLFYVANSSPCPSEISVDDPVADYGGVDNCTNIMLKYRQVEVAIFILTVVLSCLAFSVLVLHLVVRVPLSYQQYVEEGMMQLEAVLYTAMDPLTAYYTVYLAVAVYGIWRHEALTFLLLDFISKSPTSQSVLAAVYNPRKQIFFTLVLSLIIIYIFAMFQFFFFNDGADFSEENSAITLWNTFRFLLRWGLPEGTLENFMEPTIHTYRVFNDLAYFVSILLILNILKGITIDTFVELRKELEDRMADTTEKCFICGIDKNTFNRTLDRDAFRVHTKVDQNLWNYIYFIIYIWEQDKDDDDGLESYVRRCIDNQDLMWFPMNKAVRLAEYQEKGDVNSLKYRFRMDLQSNERLVGGKMQLFKDQLTRTIARVEKALEYEVDLGNKVTGRSDTARLSGTMGTLKRAATHNGADSVLSSKPGAPRGGWAGGGEVCTRTNSIIAPSRISFASSVNSDIPMDSPLPASEIYFFGGGGGGGGGSNQHSAEPWQHLHEAMGIKPNTGGTVVTHSTSPSRVPSHYLSALEMDNLVQMHVRVVAITGLHIDAPSCVEFLEVCVSSDFETANVRPTPRVLESLSNYQDLLQSMQPYQAGTEGILGPSSTISQHEYRRRERSSFQSSFEGLRSSFLKRFKEHGGGGGGGGELPDLSLVKFDTLLAPPILVHEGPLPNEHLSKYSVRIQILFGADGERKKFIGGVNVPIVELLHRAQRGSVLEVPFKQRAVGISFLQQRAPHVVSTNQDLNVVSLEDENAKLVTRRLPENDCCFVTLSAVASRELLQEWQRLVFTPK